MTARHMPWEPLERLLRARCTGDGTYTWGTAGQSEDGFWTAGLAALMLDVDVRTIHRWAAHGIPLRAADAAATAANLHPLEVWGNAWLCAEIATDVRSQHLRLATRQRERARRRRPSRSARAVEEAVRLALASERARRRAVVTDVRGRLANLSSLPTGCDTEVRGAA